MTSRRGGIRDIATIGLAVAAPVALFSGIGVGVTLIAGPPVFLVVVLAGAVAATVACLLVLAADNARTAAGGATASPDDPAGDGENG